MSTATHGTARTYLGIWGLLILAVLISVGMANTGHPVLATAVIFGIATCKAWLVAHYYMGLRREPRYVAWVLLGALLLMGVLFLCLMPDIVYVYGE